MDFEGAFLKAYPYIDGQITIKHVNKHGWKFIGQLVKFMKYLYGFLNARKLWYEYLCSRRIKLGLVTPTYDQYRGIQGQTVYVTSSTPESNIMPFMKL